MHEANRPYHEVYEVMHNQAVRKSVENTPNRGSLLPRGSSIEVINGPYENQLPDINQSRNYHPAPLTQR